MPKYIALPSLEQSHEVAIRLTVYNTTCGQVADWNGNRVGEIVSD